jgi:hypothetical protein
MPRPQDPVGRSRRAQLTGEPSAGSVRRDSCPVGIVNRAAATDGSHALRLRRAHGRPRRNRSSPEREPTPGSAAECWHRNRGSTDCPGVRRPCSLGFARPSPRADDKTPYLRVVPRPSRVRKPQNPLNWRSERLTVAQYVWPCSARCCSRPRIHSSGSGTSSDTAGASEVAAS